MGRTHSILFYDANRRIFSSNDNAESNSHDHKIQIHTEPTQRNPSRYTWKHNMTMKISPSSKLVLKYLALPNSIGGRGGAQRYFLLSQYIPFVDNLFPMGYDWAA